jgi:ribonuclease HII
MIGVDEVGRGCLAGPMLVVAARQLHELPDGVADSKTLTGIMREQLYGLIIKSCSFGEGWVTAAEIDAQGLTDATRLGVKRALDALGISDNEELIIDGHINYAPPSYTNVRTIVRADAKIPIVSAASIYAKVTRDKFMRSLATDYPDYGFEKHVGYGTAFHLSAINRYGAIEQLHRISFAPLKDIA